MSLAGEKIQPTTSEEERKVNELLEKAIPNGNCLECHLAPSFDGHKSRHYVNVGGRNGIKWRVTRLVWHVKKGQILHGLWVLHTCDNPKCIKPEHLYLGTAQDNTNDMMAKGRWASDPTVGHRRKEYTAKRIESLLRQGLTRHEITDKLGISLSTLWNYTNGPYRKYLSFPSGN